MDPWEGPYGQKGVKKGYFGHFMHMRDLIMKSMPFGGLEGQKGGQKGVFLASQTPSGRPFWTPFWTPLAANMARPGQPDGHFTVRSAGRPGQAWPGLDPRGSPEGPKTGILGVWRPLEAILDPFLDPLLARSIYAR